MRTGLVVNGQPLQIDTDPFQIPADVAAIRA
jgi:hypothetical protein